MPQELRDILETLALTTGSIMCVFLSLLSAVTMVDIMREWRKRR